MPRRLRFPLLALLLALLVSGCTGGDDLPDGEKLLTRSADVMAVVETARFALDVQGTVAGFSVRGANAQLTRGGDAAGTVTLDQGGQVAELQFVLIGDKLYVQGPTGGFQQLPASMASSIYDPAVVLDAERGIPALLRSGTDAVTEARETVGGVDTYRVRARFPAPALSQLIPGVEQDTTGQVWIGVEKSRLVQARFPLPQGTATVRLSEFDAPADITPPA